MLQLFIDPTLAATTLTSEGDSMFLGIVSVVGLVVAGVAGIVFSRLKGRKSGLSYAFAMAILQVTVPKESASNANEQQRERSLEHTRELIAAAETLIATLSALTHRDHWWERQRHLSFEIVVRHKEITFYVAVPRAWREIVEEHIHAQHHEAQIEEVSDYNIFHPQGFVVAGEMRTTREAFSPLKTYKTLESDPLNALTNVLSRLEEEEGAAIQIVFQTSSLRWRKDGKRFIREAHRLQEVHRALKRSQAPSLWRGVRDIVAAMFSSVKKDPSGHERKLSQREEEFLKAVEEKISKAGVRANIRIVASSLRFERAMSTLEHIATGFAQYNIFEYGNAFHFSKPRRFERLVRQFIYRDFDARRAFILNTEEFVSVFHLPLPTTETPNIKWLLAKKAPPPLQMPTEGILLGEAVYRGVVVPVRIKRADRQRHIYIIGRSGVGKSFLQATMARQDIQNGDGVAIIDPHGDFVEDVLDGVPAERAEDVIYFNPADIDRPMGLNLMEYDAKYPEQKTFVINEMIKIFDKLYDLRQTGGPMFEQYMRNAMLLVMEDPETGSTLMEIPKVLSDKEFRRMKIDHCHNPVVHDFWVKEAEKAGGEAALANMVPYITSKLTQFVSNDTMRPIIGQQESAFNLREIMDEKKIFLVNLSKGRLGDMNAYLIGMVMVGKILMAALSRTDVAQDKRSDFYLYIDEFQNFITDTIGIILSEARKYRLNLVIAHQYMGQLVQGQDTKIRDAVLGNAGTMISFRIGVEDAEILQKEFAPVFSAYDLVNIEKYNAYIKLLIDNQASRAFNMRTLPLAPGNKKRSEAIKELSRLKYGRDRAIVEDEILERARRAEAAEPL